MIKKWPPIKFINALKNDLQKMIKKLSKKWFDDQKIYTSKKWFDKKLIAVKIYTKMDPKKHVFLTLYKQVKKGFPPVPPGYPKNHIWFHVGYTSFSENHVFPLFTFSLKKFTPKIIIKIIQHKNFITEMFFKKWCLKRGVVFYQKVILCDAFLYL